MAHKTHWKNLLNNKIYFSRVIENAKYQINKFCTGTKIQSTKYNIAIMDIPKRRINFASTEVRKNSICRMHHHSGAMDISPTNEGASSISLCTKINSKLTGILLADLQTSFSVVCSTKHTAHLRKSRLAPNSARGK